MTIGMQLYVCMSRPTSRYTCRRFAWLEGILFAFPIRTGNTEGPGGSTAMPLVVRFRLELRSSAFRWLAILEGYKAGEAGDAVPAGPGLWSV